MSKRILHNHNNDGVDRRGFLQCMAWAGTGVVWAIESGVLTSRAFGQKMEAMFADDIARSHEIDRRQWAERPFGERVNEWRARLLEFFL